MAPSVRKLLKSRTESSRDTDIKPTGVSARCFKSTIYFIISEFCSTGQPLPYTSPISAIFANIGMFRHVLCVIGNDTENEVRL